MYPTHRISTHPGEILLEDFLKPLNVSQKDFARHIGVSVQRINEIVRGKRGVTPETAILFGKALQTSAEVWMNLQMMYDLTSCSIDASGLKPLAASRMGRSTASSKRKSGSSDGRSQRSLVKRS
jgi:addiction module HigA family antidote